MKNLSLKHLRLSKIQKITVISTTVDMLWSELGTRFFWVFALALSHSQWNPSMLFLGLKFHAFAFALPVSFRATGFLLCCWSLFALPVSCRSHVSIYIHSHTHTYIPTHTYVQYRPKNLRMFKIL
jgi:hypothetical protein